MAQLSNILSTLFDKGFWILMQNLWCSLLNNTNGIYWMFKNLIIWLFHVITTLIINKFALGKPSSKVQNPGVLKIWTIHFFVYACGVIYIIIGS
jgi:hypothetical protein